MSPVEALQPAIVLLGAGTAAALASRAVKLSPMVGYILAGVAIGPFGLGVLEEGDTTHLLAELGVVFLLFDIGLHFSIKEVREAKRDLLGLAPLQMTLCGIVFIALALAIGLEGPIAIAIGLSMALSSTAVVTNMLNERGLNTCPLGRSSISVLIFQDIIAIFLLIFAGSLSDDPNTLAVSMGLAAIQAVIAAVAAALIGRFVVRPLFRVLASADVREVFTMMAVLIVVAASAATGAAGLSLTLGAFLAGMAIADSPYRHAIQTEVTPFRGLLLSFFFVNVGLMVDVSALIRNLPAVLAVATGIILTKTVLIFVTARINRWTTPGATQLAFLLAQGSEFTLVVLSIAAVRDGTPGEVISILVAGTALSLALAPTWTGIGLRLARIIAKRISDIEKSKTRDVMDTDHSGSKVEAIVYGMTETGRIAADAFETLKVPYVALDNDPRRFVSAMADGFEVSFGNSSNFNLIESLGASDAKVIILGEARYDVSNDITGAVNERYPELKRYVGVHGPQERLRHTALGMKATVVHDRMDIIALVGDALRQLNISEDKVDEWTNDMIDRYERDEAAKDNPPNDDEPLEAA